MKNASEVEIKYRLQPGQRADLEARLGEPIRTLVHQDRYFEVPGRVLRLRFEDDHVLLTRKDKPQISADGIKSRHEVEYPIPGDLASHLAELFEWLGHRPLITVCKQRREYERAGFVVCLDRIEGLEPPDFVEIESAGGDTVAMRQLAADLGLLPAQVERRSYAAMVAATRTVKGT